MFPARYASHCPLCNNTIQKGEMIEKKDGVWAHAKCPAPKPAVPAKLEVAKPLFPPLPNVPAEEVITLYFQEGEYLSDWVPNSRSKELESLGLAHYVSGWGTKFEMNAQKALGNEFTWAQAVAYVKPLRDAEEKARVEKKAKLASNEAAKFDLAKATGKSVVLSVRSEECNDPREECNVDNITTFAMPDGTKKVIRSHTW
jgi:hypothetical protein